MMRTISFGPRLQAGLVLALVALLGALLGIMGDRVIAQQRSDVASDEMPGRPTRRDGMQRAPGMPRYGAALAERLDLSTAQRATIDTILAEEQLRVRALTAQFQPRFRAIAEQTRARVDSVLTPAQRDQLRAMRQQRMRRLGDDRPLPRDAQRPGTGRSP